MTKDLTDISNYTAKKAIADKLAERAEKGDVIGAGSGSTSLIALYALAQRDRDENLGLRFIPTSIEIQWACREAGVQTTSLDQEKPIWCFDGADEVDPNGNLIKGRGGAMYREKLVMHASRERFILVDNSKFVLQLGEKFAVPVECSPQMRHIVEGDLKKLNALDMTVREGTGKDGPVITESGYIILDVHFKQITADHEMKISSIPGILDSGLFWGYDPNILTV